MLDRLSSTIPSVTVAVAVANSTEILFSSYAHGMVFIPAGSTLTTLTWYAAEKAGGTYLPAKDQDNVVIAQTVVHTHCFQIPSALSGCRAIKAVGNAAGTMAVTLKG